MWTNGGEYVPKKIRDMIRIIKEDGWYELKRKGSSHIQYKHPTKPGKVTISVGSSLNEDLDKETEESILRQAGMK